MTDADLDNKFQALTAPHLSEAGQRRIKETIYECEHLAGIGQLMNVLVADR